MAEEQSGPTSYDLPPVDLPESPAYADPPDPAEQGTKPRSQEWNGFAIAAFALGMTALIVVPMILAAIALSQIRKRGERGKGLAIAGVVASLAWTVVIAVVLTMLASTEPVASPIVPTRNQSGEVIGGGRLSVDSVRTGDCLNNLHESSSITSVHALPCTEPHDGEVLATFVLPPGNYPGSAEVESQSRQRCLELLKERVDASSQKESLVLFTLHPVENSWAANRQVSCLVTRRDHAKLRGRV